MEIIIRVAIINIKIDLKYSECLEILSDNRM